MTAVLLALASAVAYGCADFVGGLTGKRASPWSVALVALGAGALATLVISIAAGDRFGWEPTRADLLWGVAAGLGNGAGTAFLYRGLSAGRMGVVAPVSGVGTAALPVLIGLLLGERPSMLVWAGICLALPGIWLVARDPAAGASAGPSAAKTGNGVLDGILAGVGFGWLFVCIGQFSPDAGLMPLTVNQVVGAVTVAGVATTLGASWRPTRDSIGAVLPGLLGAGSTIAFMAATQHGLLTVTAVLASLYPAFTVLLAATVLREHIHRAQLVGLACCLATVALVAGG